MKIVTIATIDPLTPPKCETSTYETDNKHEAIRLAVQDFYSNPKAIWVPDVRHCSQAISYGRVRIGMWMSERYEVMVS